MDFTKYGLTEDQVKSLETEYNTEITKIKEEAVKPYADYETLKTNLNETQLKNTTYQKDIKSLTKDKEQLQEKYNNSLMDNAINMGLIEEGIKYPDLFASKIDRNSVKLEDGKVIGLKEQISTLKDKYADILNP
ncbi:phage scaffolding protein, partial [Paraclostridium bifermentans]|uniref:phage scaffolding protein n=1 Tax=Paraclostridium bifermentans TaxID=1490 RepID=UPI002430914D